MLVVLATGTAAAQELSIGVLAGGSIPVAAYGPQDAALQSGWTGGVVIRVDAAKPPWGLEAFVGYSSRDPESADIGVVENWHATLNGVWHPRPRTATLQPYVLAGLSVDYYQDRTHNGITLAVDGGGGLSFGAGRWRPVVEARYHWTFTDGKDLRTLMLVGGLRYVL